MTTCLARIVELEAGDACLKLYADYEGLYEAMLEEIEGAWLTAPSSRSRSWADVHPSEHRATGRTGGDEKRDVPDPVAGRRFALRMSEPVAESRRAG